MSEGNKQETGAETASSAESKSASQETTPEFNKSIKDLMSQPSISGMNSFAKKLMPKSQADFIDAIKRLRKYGDKSRLAIIFLFMGVEERGDYLLWGYATLKDLVVKGCGFGSSWFYRHYNAGRVAVLIQDAYSVDELPLTYLELLSKVPESMSNRKELILDILVGASEKNGGLTEENLTQAIKDAVPEASKPGESKRVLTMKSIIRSKDAIIKDLDGMEELDKEAIKPKVAALEAATMDLLNVIK